MAAQKDNSEDDTEDDIGLFRRAMADTNRSGRNYRRARNRPEQSAPNAPKPAVAIRKTRLAETAPGGAGVMTDKTDQGDYVEFARSGLQKKIIRKLKRGDYDFTATLDLHGHTIAEAEPLLADFLLEAGDAGDSSVLIIHGKGLHSGGAGGVLKRFTLGWLKAQSAVKAFCSALPGDGGTGAVYVLLRATNT